MLLFKKRPVKKIPEMNPWSIFFIVIIVVVVIVFVLPIVIFLIEFILGKSRVKVL